MSGKSLAIVVCATWVAAAPIAAQRDSGAAGIRAWHASSAVGDSAPSPLAHGPLFTRSTAIVGGAFLAGAMITAPFDQRITNRLQAQWLQHDRGLRNTAN